MTNIVSLNDLRSKADVKYGATEVPFGDGRTACFRNLLRVADFERREFLALSEELGDKEAAKADPSTDRQVDLIQRMLLAVAANKDDARALLAEVGSDLGVLGVLLETYSSGTQAGEAEGSQS